jgi:uncharacterized protein YjiK
VRIIGLLAAVVLACDPAGDVGARGRATGAGELPAEAPSAGTTAAGVVSDAPAVSPFLERYDFENRLSRFDLPGRLDEVSGLAFSPDGRLFAHDDERGRVHEIDPITGEVGKRFDLGADLVRDDFEGIAIVEDRFFLVSSTGWLYEFREGEDRDNMDFRVTDTGVGRVCEIEGLDYDPAEDELLIACKISLPERAEIVVHRLPIAPDRERPPPVRIPKAALETFGLSPEFDPSGIAVTPTGSWLLLSGRHDALIEVSRDGAVHAVAALRKGRHPQSEGLAIGPEGTLFVSDEKNGDQARLTAYGPR